MSETLFKEVRYDLGTLVKYIELGDIGLPDIQRPFVWKSIKVRDLFDSMYRGYPVGYLLFWQSAFGNGARTVGEGAKQKSSSLLIVDGQQRLTSLYAVVTGTPVMRDTYETTPIEIAFNPLLERFEVADAAIRRDRSFIPNISTVWEEGVGLFGLVDGYLEALAKDRDVSNDDELQIKSAIQKLHSLLTFPFTALELSAQITEEQVAEVFVRINSQGTPLNQADFILTLMSVFWDEGRRELEEFSRMARKPTTGEPSSFNHFIQPSPDQLLRIGVGIGFRRARLRTVYSVLRGKDLETDTFNPELRDAQFGVLKDAQKRALNLQYWHDYLKAVTRAGYRGGRTISSQNNLLFTYILYLLGRTEFHVAEHDLRSVIAQWFFMSSLTGRYTNSPETAMEFDLARLREISDADGFVETLKRVCDETLTTDYWAIALPNELATSSPSSPSLFAYYAALILLEAKALFSTQGIFDLMDPSVHAKRSAVERHHLFPRKYLKSLGIDSTRDTNQIANYAVVEWQDNGEIGDQAPSEYVPEYRERLSPQDYPQHAYWHALPDDWEHLPYQEFLKQRRVLMAEVIRDGYAVLHGGASPESISTISMADLVGDGEGMTAEFKSTLRVNLHTGEKDPRIELASLKTIAGFLNGEGGTLLVGVADDGTALGIADDGFQNEDKMALHLVNLVRDRIGTQQLVYIHSRFDDIDGERALVVECMPSKSPAFCNDGKIERFYLRTGAATSELSASQTQAYVKERFP